MGRFCAYTLRMTTRKARKTRYETAVPLNVTLPPLLHREMLKIVAARGFKGPADYFQQRIRLDAGLNLTPDGENKKEAA